MKDLFALYWCIGFLAFLLLIAVGVILFLTLSDCFEKNKNRRESIKELEDLFFAYYNKRYVCNNYYSSYHLYKIKRYCHKVAKILVCKSYMKSYD